MASTKVIKKVGNYVLVHDIFQKLYRISDGTDLSFYFDNETKDELINLSDNDYLDRAKELIKLSDVD